MKDEKLYNELVRDIKQQGGLINWANFGCRLGFFEDPLDCVEGVKDAIKHYNGVEKYEHSAYFRDELLKLEEYMSNENKM